MLQTKNNLVKILDFVNLPKNKDSIDSNSSNTSNSFAGVRFPVCAMTLRAAGSMRFRWAEKNPVRDKMFSQICGDFAEFADLTNFTVCVGTKTPVPVQLDHTHIVYDVKNAGDTYQKIGDGIITTNRELVPTITVADCVPIFLFDPVTGVFGIVHSGWKGTGIIADAIELARENYGARACDFRVIIGPHIHDCCYIVDDKRAKWFSENFTPECVRPLENGTLVDWKFGDDDNTLGKLYDCNTWPVKLYRLSLARANLAVLEKAGVPFQNINVYDDCTCCDTQFGSNRRETKENGRPDLFTVQAAFIRF